MTLETSKEPTWATEEKFTALTKAGETLNKKARKMGQPEMVITTYNTRFMRVVETVEHTPSRTYYIHRLAPMDYLPRKSERIIGIAKQIQFTVTGEPPKFQDWTFVAALDHSPNGNVIRSIPGTTIPVKYVTADCTCDHCLKQRSRNNTFVLYHPQEGYKQIGRSCLKDFLGHPSAEKMAAMAADAWQVFSDRDSDEESYTPSDKFYDLSSYLPWVVASIRVEGWLSSKAAEAKYDDSYLSTAHVSFSRFLSRKDHKELNPTADDRQQALDVIAWAKAIKDEQVVNNTYMSNLRILALNGVFESPQTGLAGAMAISYQKRDMDMSEKQEKRPSMHLGFVGQKLVVENAELVKQTQIAGNYGVTTLYTFKDLNDNWVKWFSSRDLELKNGTKYRVEGTVKAHEDFKGMLSTSVTRAKVTEV